MYLLGHQGWTDFLSQFALYVHFGGTVLVVDPNQLPFVRRLAMHANVGVELMQTTEEGGGVCVVCHQRGHPNRCPRTGNTRCRYPDRSKYSSIQGLCVFDDPDRWSAVHAQTLSQGKSFVEAFYVYHGLPIETMWTLFPTVRTLDDELPSPVSGPYLAYHMQPGVAIPLSRLRRDLQQVSLDRRCSDFFGCLRILEGATEIHVVQSSYCMLLYLFQLKTGLFGKTRIYVHASARHNAETDYKGMHRHPQLSNWTFL